MKISREQAEAIRGLINSTRHQELNCNELLDKIGEYVEFQKSGGAIPLELDLVKHHLSLCRECEEEYEALMSALAHLEEEDEEPRA